MIPCTNHVPLRAAKGKMKLLLTWSGAALLLSLSIPAAPPLEKSPAPVASPKTITDTATPPLASQDLTIGTSTTPVAGGKATLTIGPLRREKGIYTGTYKITVNPYFFKNENGRLAIIVPDPVLAQAADGKVVTVTGTATASGKGGEVRRIDAIATPAAKDHGSLKLWFMVGDRKMVFEPQYQFAETTGIPSAASETPSDPAQRAISPAHAGSLR